MDNLRIIISGDNGESIPPPYGGIMKRCLLHAKYWKTFGGEVSMHVHHAHKDENDLGAGASYFYDYAQKPRTFDKVLFIFGALLENPFLFTALLLMEFRFSIGRDYSYAYWAAKGVRLNREVHRIKPHIIVSETGGFPSLMAIEVARRNNIPVVLENYAEMQYKGDTEGKNFAPEYHALWTHLVDKSALVISASKHCTKGPLAYAKDSSKVKIIYSGINFDTFNSRIDRDKNIARAKFGLPTNRFIVMAVGSLKMRKGHDQLFESLVLLPEETRKKVFVTLCGMGDTTELIERADEMGFGNDGLKIFGGLSEDDLAELYSAADAFCFPSVTPRECMGMAMKEAMAIGLPIAAYDAGGISEAIEDGVNGYLAPVVIEWLLPKGLPA